MQTADVPEHGRVVQEGTTLDHRYKLTRLVGRGGMSRVFSAVDLETDRTVAVKILRVGEQAQSDRFAAEVEILERLHHPAIVRMLDTGTTTEKTPYFVMQYIEGKTLSSRLRDHGPLDAVDVQGLAARIASALVHAHENGVVHRDIKPANIMIDPSGRGFLTDFGVARLVDETVVTKAGTTIGTAAYLAPEQLHESAVGPEADVYSLGLVLLEALTGERAFPGAGMQAAMARLGRDPVIPESLDPMWTGLLFAMTKRDKADRPTATEVEQILRGRSDPPTVTEAELEARDEARPPSDELPTEIVEESIIWDPPSLPEPEPEPKQLPPPPESSNETVDSAVPTTTLGTPEPDKSERMPRWAWVLITSVLVLTAVVFSVTLLSRPESDDPVTGSDPVDDATREVISVVEASDTLGASDPALQRRLRLLSNELAGAVNNDDWDLALRTSTDMRETVENGLEQIDIESVAVESLMDALAGVTRQIENEQLRERGGE